MHVRGSAVAAGDSHVTVTPQNVARTRLADRHYASSTCHLRLALVRQLDAKLTICPRDQTGAIERIRSLGAPYIRATDTRASIRIRSTVVAGRTAAARINDGASAAAPAAATASASAAVATALVIAVAAIIAASAVAAGQGMFGTCAVEHWQDITAIAAGHMHSLGLRKDGRLLQADGFIAPGVLDWTDLTAVAVGPYHTVAVKQDGTAVASGDIQHGQCQVEAWTNVRTVAAGERHTVALCADGRVMAVGDDSAGQCDGVEALVRS